MFWGWPLYNLLINQTFKPALAAISLDSDVNASSIKPGSHLKDVQYTIPFLRIDLVKELWIWHTCTLSTSKSTKLHKANSLIRQSRLPPSWWYSFMIIFKIIYEFEMCIFKCRVESFCFLWTYHQFLLIPVSYNIIVAADFVIFCPSVFCSSSRFSSVGAVFRIFLMATGCHDLLEGLVSCTKARLCFATYAVL